MRASALTHFLARRPATALAALGLGFASLLASTAAHAQALLVQRGDTLYSADPAGAAPARRLFALGNPADALWAVAPDGRRIAALSRAGDATAPANLASRPATVTLSEIGGRHRKHLFATDALHDRLNRTVTTLGLGDDDGKFADWEPVSLSWSADSRTLYVSCFAAASGAKATFAVDGASGAALVDAQGRWKSIAPLTAIDARGGRLVGTTTSATPLPNPPTRAAERAGSLMTIDLSTGTRTSFAPTSGVTLAPDAITSDPSLSPDERRIVFSAAPTGLILLTRSNGSAQQAVAGLTARPRWSPDGKSVYFLLQRPGSETAPVFDLYAINTPDTDAKPLDPLRLVLQGVDWFDVVAD